MAWFTHEFDGTVARHLIGGTLRYTVVWCPPEVAATLPFASTPRLRIEADVSGHPIHGAWQPAGGRWYLMLPKSFLRTAALAVGDVVTVAFRVVDQARVDVPAELDAALRRHATARRAWEALTPGAQRGMAYRVESARKAETRAARVAEVLEALAAGRRIGPPTRAALAARRTREDR
jgi:hypothetical protein